jgi:hypothetical protein
MATYQNILDLKHDPKLAEALGNMVVAWAYAETAIFYTFARVTDVGLIMAQESIARIPTFESRVKFVLALVHEWRSGTYDKPAVTTAIEKLAKLASARNHWMHGHWAASEDKTKTVVFNARAHRDSTARIKPVKATDVLQHCEAVKARADQLADLIKWEELDT